MIAILEGTETAKDVEFIYDDFGSKLLFKTYCEADDYLVDNSESGRTYQMWADGSHDENDSL